MNIFVNILVPIICLLIGYLMGSANISIPLGKMVFKQDPREFGSHNPGATNCGRLWGKNTSLSYSSLTYLKQSPHFISVGQS